MQKGVNKLNVGDVFRSVFFVCIYFRKCFLYAVVSYNETAKLHSIS